MFGCGRGLLADSRKDKDRRLRTKYGIGVDHYDALLESQGGVCAICRLPETATDPRSNSQITLSVDHCHDTGKIRGLLCQRCNRAIGYMKDSAALHRRAADYIDTHKGEAQVNLREYQHAVMNGAMVNTGTDKLAHAALGLAGEAGEVADVVKKGQYTGKTLDIPRLVEELGDTLWYLTFLAGNAGYTLDDIASLNIEKLKARYPETYANARV